MKAESPTVNTNSEGTEAGQWLASRSRRQAIYIYIYTHIIYIGICIASYIQGCPLYWKCLTFCECVWALATVENAMSCFTFATLVVFSCISLKWK